MNQLKIANAVIVNEQKFTDVTFITVKEFVTIKRWLITVNFGQ